MTLRSIGLTLGALVLLAICPFIGPGLDGDQGSFILWQLRVPRTLMGAMVGATLGLAGAVYQTLFSNPLATPSTVGTTAGAALGALIAIIVLGPTSSGLPVVAGAAFLGAIMVTLFIASIAASGRARVNDVLLAGIAITLAAGALSTGLQLRADMAATFRAVQWSLGNLSEVGYGGVLVLAPFVLLSCGVLLSQIRAMEALVAGETRAHSQGVSVTRVRTLGLGAGALGVGACVAWCGPIAFVGLIVPHLVRLTVGASRRVLLPMSTLLGASFLTLCDAIGRVALSGHELPAGVVTAVIGAPLLVWLVARQRS